MILLHLGMHLSEFILYYILEFALCIEFLRIFAGYFEEFEAGFEYIRNCLEQADYIAIAIEQIFFTVFFLLRGRFALIFVQVLGTEFIFDLSDYSIDFNITIRYNFLFN
jgi:hypothetical protein